jgi:hypothetical protein
MESSNMHILFFFVYSRLKNAKLYIAPRDNFERSMVIVRTLQRSGITKILRYI